MCFDRAGRKIIHQLFILDEHLIKVTRNTTKKHLPIHPKMENKKNNHLIIVTPQNLSENKPPRGEGTCFLFPILKAYTGTSMFKWQ